jgi:hypothetical protein
MEKSTYVQVPRPWRDQHNSQRSHSTTTSRNHGHMASGDASLARWLSETPHEEPFNNVASVKATVKATVKGGNNTTTATAKLPSHNSAQRGSA